MSKKVVLEWTASPEANTLLVESPDALLIGFCLDQQIPVEKAFVGPLLLKQRLGTLDANTIASMPEGELQEIFCTKPAIHRFPSTMASRVQSLCRHIAAHYTKTSDIWNTSLTAKELKARLLALPGFGDMKVDSLYTTLVKQFEIHPSGWENLLPTHPTLGDVSTMEDRKEYQALKKEWKAKNAAVKH